jgi:hypothetical protein
MKSCKRPAVTVLARDCFLADFIDFLYDADFSFFLFDSIVGASGPVR